MIGSANNLVKREGRYLCDAVSFQTASKNVKSECLSLADVSSAEWLANSWRADMVPSAPAFDDNDGFVLSAKIFVDKKPEFYEFSNITKRSTEADVLARFSEKRG